ncbi:hypothetical protein [Rhizobium grahamii]|nr:hypothetical protein [Rhizobium grahamii]
MDDLRLERFGDRCLEKGAILPERLISAAGQGVRVRKLGAIGPERSA